MRRFVRNHEIQFGCLIARASWRACTCSPVCRTRYWDTVSMIRGILGVTHHGRYYLVDIHLIPHALPGQPVADTGTPTQPLGHFSRCGNILISNTHPYERRIEQLPDFGELGGFRLTILCNDVDSACQNRMYCM